MDFDISAELQSYLNRVDDFITTSIQPLENENDNIRFFDHRREWARTDFDGGGLPRKEWEELLRTARDRSDAAGYLRFQSAKEIWR